MIDYALTSLQPTASQVTVTHGLLNSPDLLGWLFAAFLIAAGLFIMLPAASESFNALWAPVGRWLAGLSALLDLRLWDWTPLGPVEAPKELEKIFEVVIRAVEQLLRKAYLGFIPPILT
jgi:hypothetical protein